MRLGASVVLIERIWTHERMLENKVDRHCLLSILRARSHVDLPATDTVAKHLLPLLSWKQVACASGSDRLCATVSHEE